LDNDTEIHDLNYKTKLATAEEQKLQHIISHQLFDMNR